MQSIDDIREFIGEQGYVTSLLRTVDGLGVTDCWIGAGLIRNAVWDRLHGIEPRISPGTDVDVVFCDHEDSRLQRDLGLLENLRAKSPSIPWSVHNQARMHHRNDDRPYRNVEDAISHWPETATAIAARLNNGRIDLITPHGVGDLLNLVVRPTPAFADKLTIYKQRVERKDWRRRWPKLEIVWV